MKSSASSSTPQAANALCPRWSEETEARLRELHATGLSFGRIAAELGMSRNAVIGKAHRLRPRLEPRKTLLVESPPGHNLRKPAKAGTPPPAPMAALGWRPSKAALARLFPVANDDDDGALVLGHAFLAPNSRKITIEAITATTCVFPIGDPRDEAFCYCGAPKPANGKPYCAAHAAVAYRPPIDRKPASPHASK